MDENVARNSKALSSAITKGRQEVWDGNKTRTHKAVKLKTHWGSSAGGVQEDLLKIGSYTICCAAIKTEGTQDASFVRIENQRRHSLYKVISKCSSLLTNGSGTVRNCSSRSEEHSAGCICTS
jgi:hypothetical protein